MGRIFTHVRRWLAWPRRGLSWIWQGIPLSVGGLLAGLAAWWAFSHYGHDRSDFVLQSATLVVLAVVGASALCVGLAALRILFAVRTSSRTLVEANIDAGTELRTGFSLPALRFWPLAQVEMTWRQPAEATVQTVLRLGRLEERVVLGSRGRYVGVVRVFTVRDIFGLATVRFTRRAPAHLRVAPAPAMSEVVVALRHASGEGYAHPAGMEEGDRVEMRRYAPGDPQRMILWKVYARSRRLLVRIPERAIAPKPSSVACFVAGTADEPTASTARMFIENGLLGADFSFVADGDSPPARQADEALERVIESASYRARSGQRLLQLIRDHDRAELTNCILFVPGRRGPWMEHLRAILPELPAPPTLVLAVDGDLDHPVPGRVGRWVLQQPTQTTGLRGLPALYDELVALGVTVWVVHRPSGTAIDGVRMDALREAA